LFLVLLQLLTIGGATYNDITVILLKCSGFFIFEK